MKSDRAPQPASGRRKVFSLCGMCATRCPIEVEVEREKVVWIQGNPNDPAIGSSLCAKGSAGLAMEYDDERPQQPLIRKGPRGGGEWRRASWPEVLDYVAGGLKKVIDRCGGRGVVLSDRGGPFADLTKSFLKALGSPNYFNHDCACGGNANHATKSLFGLGRTDLSYDLKNMKHIVLCGRNIIESLQVKEAKAFMQALNAGARCTYIDPRATLTAAKATRYWQIRPNTEYALYLSFIHAVLEEELYDKDFVSRWVSGLGELKSFVQDKTPEWQESYTGIPAGQVRDFIHEIAEDAPKVIFHAGWMSARHRQSFYSCRAANILNALFGTIEVQGGSIIAKSAADAGRKGLNKIADSIPKVSERRVDGCGWKYPHFDAGAGILHLLFPAIESGEPYPVGAYIAYRHDPLSGMPDPDEIKKSLNRLDLLVSIDINYSEFGWFSDVILPESTYLERANILAEHSGPKPNIQMRDQAVAPRFDSRPAWWIFKELAARLGAGQYFNWETIEDAWAYQLKDTGITIDQLREKGMISLSDKPMLFDRDKLKFKTPSGKIEFISEALTKAGVPSLVDFQAPPELEKDEFLLLFGRSAIYNHAHTANNPLLHELMPENPLWMHPSRAEPLGITDGSVVELSRNGYSAKTRVFITPWIHPEAVFLLHGFGRTVPLQTRAFNRGVADQRLQKGLLTVFDPAGGGNAMCECTVRVSRA